MNLPLYFVDPGTVRPYVNRLLREVDDALADAVVYEMRYRAELGVHSPRVTDLNFQIDTPICQAMYDLFNEAPFSGKR